jgi:flagellar motility protein MotE (MotC chaperone)
VNRRRLLAAAALFCAAPGSFNAAVAVAQEAQTAAAYCANLADAAQDARFANKLARIAEAEHQVEERITALEAKRAETEEWLTKRETFLKMAEQNLVAIYSGMAADSAAAQLAQMPQNVAAAIVAKLQPKTAAAILNEMDAAKAATLAGIIAGLSRPSDEVPS